MFGITYEWDFTPEETLEHLQDRSVEEQKEIIRKWAAQYRRSARSMLQDVRSKAVDGRLTGKELHRLLEIYVAHRTIASHYTKTLKSIKTKGERMVDAINRLDLGDEPGFSLIGRPTGKVVFSVSVDSRWYRPVDGTIIRIAELLGDGKLKVEVLAGSLCGDELNCGLLRAFWSEVGK